MSDAISQYMQRFRIKRSLLACSNVHPNSSNIHQNQTLARRQLCKPNENGALAEAWRKFYMVRGEGGREGEGVRKVDGER